MLDLETPSMLQGSKVLKSTLFLYKIISILVRSLALKGSLECAQLEVWNLLNRIKGVFIQEISKSSKVKGNTTKGNSEIGNTKISNTTRGNTVRGNRIKGNTTRGNTIRSISKIIRFYRNRSSSKGNSLSGNSTRGISISGTTISELSIFRSVSIGNSLLSQTD